MTRVDNFTRTVQGSDFWAGLFQCQGLVMYLCALRATGGFSFKGGWGELSTH